MSTNSEALRQWENHCLVVQEWTTLERDRDGDQAARVARALDDYAFFASYYFPHYASVESPDFHVRTARYILAHPRARVLLNWHRGGAKSVFADIILALWLKLKGEMRFMLLIGKSQEAAWLLLGDLQAELMENQRLIRDFGPQHKHGSWQDGEFTTADGCFFKAIGMRQNPEGSRKRAQRPDYIVVDDIDSLEMSANPSRVTKNVEWIRRSVLGTFDVGRARFIMSQNRKAEDGVMPRLAKLKTFKEIKVPIADQWPNPTKVSWPQKYSLEFLADLCEEVGLSAFLTEYMLQPTFEGAVFKKEMVRWLHVPPAKIIRRVAYIDPSWTDTAASCHKAVSIWGKYLHEKVPRYHKLKSYIRQSSTKNLVEWCYDYQKALPEHISLSWMIEANFMQDAHLNQFITEGQVRGWQLRIIADKRSKPKKESRILDMVPLYERKWITFESSQQNDPDMLKALEFMHAWEPGSKVPNDGMDADEGAIYKLERDGLTSTSGIRIGRPRTGKSRI